MQAMQEALNKSMNTGFNPGDIQVIQHYCCCRCQKEVKVARIRMTIGPQKGKVVTHEEECNCRLLDELEESHQKAKERKLQRIFERNSLINPALLDASFENFEGQEFSKPLKQAKRFAETFDPGNPRNLFFQGSFGTGKSHLSVAITKEVTKRGYSTIFISTPKLLTKIGNTYNRNNDDTEEDVMQAIGNADLVVFDDIGAEGDRSGWAMRKIFEVLDQRAGKHNVYTTNLSSKDFEANMDLNRIFSRMMMNAEPVVMNGTDYRKKQFLKGASEDV